MDAVPVTTGDRHRHPEDVSPDGSVLLFHEHHPTRGTDIVALSLDGTGDQALYAQSEFNEHVATFSPDGCWLAYQSDESGRGGIYVGPYPAPGARLHVSTAGGAIPRWSADGKHIFYLEGNQLMSVDVRGTDELTLGVPKLASEGRLTFGGNVNAGSIFNPHGDRFLVIKSEEQSRREINVVLNWFQELERLAPRVDNRKTRQSPRSNTGD